MSNKSHIQEVHNFVDKTTCTPVKQICSLSSVKMEKSNEFTTVNNVDSVYPTSECKSYECKSYECKQTKYPFIRHLF